MPYVQQMMDLVLVCSVTGVLLIVFCLCSRCYGIAVLWYKSDTPYLPYIVTQSPDQFTCRLLLCYKSQQEYNWLSLSLYGFVDIAGYLVTKAGEAPQLGQASNWPHSSHSFYMWDHLYVIRYSRSIYLLKPKGITSSYCVYFSYIMILHFGFQLLLFLVVIILLSTC